MRSKGFTLVELLIVMAILTVLYSIAAANVKGLQEEARHSKAAGDLRTIQLSINAYIKTHKVCPQKDNYQVILSREVPNFLTGNYYDPFAGSLITPYSYSLSDNSSYYAVFSIGPSKNGTVSVDDTGHLSIVGSPVYVTNGYN